MTQLEFLKRIIDLMPLASPDETRYHLQGVHVMNERDKLVLKVTDGHRAIVETVEIESDDFQLVDDMICAELEAGFMVHRENLRVLKNAYKIIKAMDINLRLEGRSLAIKSVFGDFAIPVTFECKLPDLEKLIPKRGSHCLGLNAKYLFDIAKALDCSKLNNVAIWIDLSLVGDGSPDRPLEVSFDNRKPFIVSSPDGLREAVLMPVRIDHAFD